MSFWTPSVARSFFTFSTLSSAMKPPLPKEMKKEERDCPTTSAGAASATAESFFSADSAFATPPARSSSSDKVSFFTESVLTESVLAESAMMSVVWRVRYWSIRPTTCVNFSDSARILNSSLAVEPTRALAVESSTPASSTTMRSSPVGEICGSERPYWSTRLRIISRDCAWMSLISSPSLRLDLSIWRVMLVPPARSKPKLMDFVPSFGFSLRKVCLASPFLE